MRHSHTRPGRRRARAAHAVKDALTPWHAGYDYDDFADIPAPASGAPARASYRRLQKIKASYDPGLVIISTHPVWPARAGHEHGGPGRGDTRPNDSSGTR